MKKLILICFTLIALGATPALAQLNTNSFIDTQLTVELKPEFPMPGEEVTATLNDYSGGTYGSSVTWVLSGQEIPNSMNQRSITFTAGPSGVTQTIEAVLTKPSGGREVLRKTFRPVYLDIVVEPQTRVPNFYLGRSLPSLGSLVNATALVDISGVSVSQLIYTWRINKQVIEAGPIRGRNQVTFETPMGNSAILSVRVTDLGGNIIASRAVLLPSVAPEIHFYEVSALFGMNQKPVDTNLPLIGNSLTVRAEPYYLDSRVYNNPDFKEWEIGKVSSTNTGNNPYEVTLQRAGSFGTTNLNFHVRDLKQVLQGAEASIQINF